MRNRSVESEVSLVPSVWNTTVLRNETNGNATSVTSFHVSTTPTPSRSTPLVGVGRIPFEPRLTLGAAALEHKQTAWAQPTVGRPKRLGPLVVFENDLGNVPRHRRHIDLHRREVRCHTVNPANAIRACLAPSDGEHCGSRIYADDLEVVVGKEAGKRPRAAPDVGDRAGAVLVHDGAVVVQVAPVWIEVVIDLSQPWLVEDAIRHAMSLPRLE